MKKQLKEALSEINRKSKALITSEENTSEDFLGSIDRYIKQKWYCEIFFKLKGGYSFKHKALINLGTDVNYMREDLIPLIYCEKSTQKI